LYLITDFDVAGVTDNKANAYTRINPRLFYTGSPRREPLTVTVYGATALTFLADINSNFSPEMEIVDRVGKMVWTETVTLTSGVIVQP
jgi:hypothetical protein